MSQAFFMITVNTFEECTLNGQKTKTTTHLIFTMLFGYCHFYAGMTTTEDDTDDET